MVKFFGASRSWKWWVAKWLGLPLLLLGLLVGTFVLCLNATFYPSSPKPDYQQAQTLAEAQAQDLDYFGHFFELEKSYTPEAMAEAKALVEALKQRVGEMTPAQFDLEIGRVVALADNGHSNVFASMRSRRFGRIDIRSHWFDDGLFVLRATEGLQDLLGARIVAINEINIEDYVSAFASYYGGTPAYKRDMSPYFIEAPELLQAAGFPVEGKSAHYRFEMPDGAIVVRELTAGDADPDAVRAFPYEWMYVNPKEGEGPEWRPVLWLEDDALPLYLKQDHEAFTHTFLPDINAHYIQLRQNSNSETQKIGAVLKEAIGDIRKLKPKHIILDVRFNGGGDYTTTSRHVKKLPGLIPDDGRIFLISGSETFSAGMSTMGFVKQAAPEKVTIVGLEPGDRMQFWSEGLIMTLPNSKIKFRYSTGYVDMVNPCTDYTKCFWIGAFYPIEIDDLSPDV